MFVAGAGPVFVGSGSISSSLSILAASGFEGWTKLSGDKADLGYGSGSVRIRTGMIFSDPNSKITFDPNLSSIRPILLCKVWPDVKMMIKTVLLSVNFFLKLWVMEQLGFLLLTIVFLIERYQDLGPGPVSIQLNCRIRIYSIWKVMDPHDSHPNCDSPDVFRNFVGWNHFIKIG